MPNTLTTSIFVLRTCSCTRLYCRESNAYIYYICIHMYIHVCTYTYIYIHHTYIHDGSVIIFLYIYDGPLYFPSLYFFPRHYVHIYKAPSFSNYTSSRSSRYSLYSLYSPYTYVYTYVCIYIRMYTHMYVYTYVCIHICMYIHTYVHIYICIHIHKSGKILYIYIRIDIYTHI